MVGKCKAQNILNVESLVCLEECEMRGGFRSDKIMVFWVGEVGK